MNIFKEDDEKIIQEIVEQMLNYISLIPLKISLNNLDKYSLIDDVEKYYLDDCQAILGQVCLIYYINLSR